MILPNKLHCKLLALFLTFTLLCSILLTADFSIAEVHASEGNGTWGNNGVTWDFNNGTLTIHGNGATHIQDTPYTNEGVTSTFHIAWYYHEKQIKKVVIDEGITSIGSWVFYDFYPNLETVIFPSTLTKIGDYTFSGCKKLRTVNLPNGLKTIGQGAFSDCVNLNDITIPSTVTKIDRFAFFGCNSFTSLIIPPNLKTVKSSFSNCKNLKSVKFSIGITKISEADFAGCPNIKTIDLPASVSSIGARAFDDCNKLSSVKIHNKNCKIDSHPLTFPKKTVLYGHRNSTAEKYAKKHNLKFKTLSGSSDSNTIKVKKLKIVGAPKTLKVGKGKTLKVKITPSNATKKSVTWKSSNKKYATVSSKGKVKAKKAGKGKTVKITAVAKDGSKKKATVKITIQ